MVARPTLEEGLTGRKAAQLLLDNSWGELGVPSNCVRVVETHVRPLRHPPNIFTTPRAWG